MKISDQILKILDDNKSVQSAPEGLCPNCWGRQEYGGKFYEAIKKEKVDLKNADQKRGWIQAYAAKYLGGIKLFEKHNEMICSNCQIDQKASGTIKT